MKKNKEIYSVEAEDMCSFCSHTTSHFLNRIFETLRLDADVLPPGAAHMSRAYVLLMCKKT